MSTPVAEEPTILALAEPADQRRVEDDVGRAPGHAEPAVTDRELTQGS
jgi:hypothetical protein